MVKLQPTTRTIDQPAMGAAPVYPSTAAIAGHPIHPMLIPFPIAFLSGALVTDIVYVCTNRVFWALSSRWLLIAGVAMGLLAAVFGVIDFLTIPQVRARMQGWLHPIAAVTSVLLAVVNIVLRWNDPITMVVPWGISLSALMFVVLIGAGWLGGELAFRHRIGVNAAQAGELPPTLATTVRTDVLEEEAEVGGRFVTQREKIEH